MKFEKEALQSWLAARNSRELTLIFLVGFAFIYVVWSLVFELPLQRKQAAIEKESQLAETTLEADKENLKIIQQIISSSTFTHSIGEQKLLSREGEAVGGQLKNAGQQFVPLSVLSKITNDLIAEQATVSLISMKTFSEEPWLKAKGPDLYAGLNLQDVYKHKMEIEFRGTYFNSIAFLAHLEKLPWHLYWDHLEYQVLTYPEAKVVARFYVLSDQKG